MQKILVCPDTHVPYHDKKALALFRRVAEGINPDVLIFLGDFCDFYSVSSHSKSPSRKVGLKKELAACNKELDKFTGLAKRTIFLAGNHEDRLRRYSEEKAEALDGIYELEDLLKLSERGWEYIPYKQFISIGKMSFCHDIGRSGKNAASQTLADFGHNITFGHSHRGCVYYTGTVRGEHHVCLNAGWLGDPLQADYMHVAKAHRDWQQGFGLVYVLPKGDCAAHFIPIVNGKCIVEGKVYK